MRPEYKIPLYVAAGVPAWIVNIAPQWVDFYGSPEDLELANGQVFRDTFDVLGGTVAVASLFARLSGPSIDVACATARKRTMPIAGECLPLIDEDV